jgi:hypothetical protein
MLNHQNTEKKKLYLEQCLKSKGFEVEKLIE